MASSRRNPLRGRVTHASVREIVLKLEVDVGRGIVARISKEDLRKLDLKTGMDVYVTIKASAVHVF